MTLDPKPQRATPRKKSPANLLLLMPGIAVMGGLSIGALWLVEQLQFLRCPAGTFLAGSGRLASLFQAIPIFMASIGFGFLIVNWLTYAVRPVRRFFDREAKRYGEPGYHASQRGLLKFSAAVLAAMLPIILTASLSQFCLADDAILYQREPWSGLKRYAWGDVSRIETSCTHGSRGGQDSTYILVMRDGAQISLMEWPRGFARAYPQMRRALAGGAFSFDQSAVRPYCSSPFADLLRTRP